MSDEASSPDRGEPLNGPAIRSARGGSLRKRGSWEKNTSTSKVTGRGSYRPSGAELDARRQLPAGDRIVEKVTEKTKRSERDRGAWVMDHR